MRSPQHLMTLGLMLALSQAGLAATRTTPSGLGGAARSGMATLAGDGFGMQEGQLLIGGIPAHVSRWRDKSITYYVAEETPTGANSVQVLTASGLRALGTVEVRLRSPPKGRVRWRFQVDAEAINGRPGMGADGTIYSADLNGHLYALRPDGALRWIFNAAPGAAVRQSVDVGSDGTIYFARGNSVYAVNPDGTQKWRVSDQISFRSVVGGPNVGPNGNIYAATADYPQDGLGFFILSPAGQILDSTAGFFEGDNAAFLAREILFRADRVILQLGNQEAATGGLSFLDPEGALLFGRVAVNDRNPAIGPNGTIYAVVPPTTSFSDSNLRAYELDGDTVRTYFGENTSYVTTPDVGMDGTIYVGRNLNLITALTPAGTQKWQFTGTGILDNPTVNGQNSVVVIGGYGLNTQGFIQGIATNNGQLRWTVRLPEENGGFVRPSSRPTFSPDGATVYVGTSLSSSAPTQYSYLYAIEAAPRPPPRGRLLALAQVIREPVPRSGIG